jgi:hypothetical protein
MLTKQLKKLKTFVTNSLKMSKSLHYSAHVISSIERRKVWKDQTKSEFFYIVTLEAILPIFGTQNNIDSALT